MVFQTDYPQIGLLMDYDLSEFAKVRVSLVKDDVVLKAWTKDDIVFTTTDDGYLLTLPVTQAESGRFPPGRVVFSVRGEDADGELWVFEEVPVVLMRRSDRTAME